MPREFAFLITARCHLANGETETATDIPVTVEAGYRRGAEMEVRSAILDELPDFDAEIVEAEIIECKLIYEEADGYADDVPEDTPSLPSWFEMYPY